MAEEFLVNITPQETRVAVIENGVLQELAIERTANRGIVGNIYAGTVCRVLPGMGAAFLEIGLQRTAFLHVSDIAAGPNEDPDGSERTIERAVHEGQHLVVQVTKDPLGSKGARLTTQLSIPSRYLVYMPESNTVGVSQRIEDEDERQRLRDLITNLRPGLRPLDELAGTVELSRLAVAEGSGGFIARTAAEGVEADELNADMEFLERLWQSVQERINSAKAPEKIFEDLPLVLRTIRDISIANVEKVRIDSTEIMNACAASQPNLRRNSCRGLNTTPASARSLIYIRPKTRFIVRCCVKSNLNPAVTWSLIQTEAMTTIERQHGRFCWSPQSGRNHLQNEPGSDAGNSAPFATA